ALVSAAGSRAGGSRSVPPGDRAFGPTGPHRGNRGSLGRLLESAGRGRTGPCVGMGVPRWPPLSVGCGGGVDTDLQPRLVPPRPDRPIGRRTRRQSRRYGLHFLVQAGTDRAPGGSNLRRVELRAPGPRFNVLLADCVAHRTVGELVRSATEVIRY